MIQERTISKVPIDLRRRTATLGHDAEVCDPGNGTAANDWLHLAGSEAGIHCGIM